MKYSVGDKIGTGSDVLAYLERVNDVMTDLEKKRNVKLRYDLDIKGREEAENLLQLFDEKSRNGMNDYFAKKDFALKRLVDTYDDLQKVMRNAKANDMLETESYKQDYERIANSIVRQANAYMALGGSAEDAREEIFELAKAQEKVLMKKSGGGYQYTVDNFKELFDIMNKLIPFLEKSDGLSKNFASFSIKASDLAGIRTEVEKAVKYINEVFEKYGTGELQQGTRNEIMKNMGIIKEFYDRMASLKHPEPQLVETLKTGVKMDIPMGFTQEPSFGKGQGIISSKYVEMLDTLREAALKGSAEAQKELTDSREALVDEWREVIDMVTSGLDDTKKKIAYLKVEQEKKLASEWGSFANTKPKFSVEGGTPGAYTDNKAFNAATAMYDDLLDQIEQGAITADEAIKKMAEDLITAVSYGAANPLVSDEVVVLQGVIDELREKVDTLTKSLKAAREEAEDFENSANYQFEKGLGLEKQIDELQAKLNEKNKEIEALVEENQYLKDNQGYGDGYGYGTGYEGNYSDTYVEELQKTIDDLTSELRRLQDKLKYNEPPHLDGAYTPDYVGLAIGVLSSVEKYLSMIDWRGIDEIPESLNDIATRVAGISNTVSSIVEFMYSGESGEYGSTGLNEAVENLIDILKAEIGELRSYENSFYTEDRDYENRQMFKAMESEMEMLENKADHVRILNDISEWLGQIDRTNTDEFENIEKVLDAISINVKTLKDIIASGKGSLGITNVTNLGIGGEEDPTARKRYDELMEAYNSIFSITALTKSVKDESGNSVLKTRTRKAKVGEQSTVSFDDIVGAIFANLPTVAAKYSSNIGAFEEVYSLSKIQTQPITDRIKHLEELLGWIKELSKADLNTQLTRVIKKASRGFPDLESEATVSDQLGFSDTINQMLETLREIARKVAEISEALSTGVSNDIPDLNSQFLSDRGQILKDLFGRISTTAKGSISGRASNAENIKNFLQQFNAYGNGEWSLDEFARINNISKKNLEVLKKYNEELFKQEETVEEIVENYQLPDATPIETQKVEAEEKSIENLQEEKEELREVNALLEEKHDLENQPVSQEEKENVEEEKSDLKEVNALLEEKNDLQKEGNALSDENAAIEEQSSIAVDIDKKDEAFKEEKETVNTVVDAEKEKLNELKESVEAVTKSVKDKTKAFEDEAKKVRKVAEEEKDALKDLPAIITDPNYIGETAGSRTSEAERRARAEGQPLLTGTLEGMTEELEEEFPDWEKTVLSYIKAMEAFDNLLEKIPEKMMNAEIHFKDVMGESYSRTIGQATEDIGVRTHDINEMGSDTPDEMREKLNAMKEMTPIIAKYTSSISEMIKTNDTLADSLSMKKVKNNIQDYLSSNTALTREQREHFIKLKTAIEDAFDPAGNNVTMTKEEFKKIIGEIEEAQASVKQMGNEGHNALYKVSQQVAHLNEKWVGQLLSFHDIIRYIRTMYTEIKNIDSALIELKKVTDGLTMERLNVSLENSFDTARKLGAEVTEVINTTADWARLGYGIEDAEKLAEVTTLFKNVGDNMTTDTASEYLISTLKGFEMVPEEALGIVDRFNEVANNFAIDTAGIGEALERSSASFNAANTSLSESIALVTTANAVVQNPESVGTTFKTLSARIRGAKTELEELGEEEDDFTKSTSKLRDMVKGMTGFDIMEDEDTFKSIYEIMIGIGKEWDNLTDVERASLGEALAGKRNSNVLYAIMNNIEDLEKAYETAENAAGSATKEQENYQKSIQYSVDVFKSQLSELYTRVLNSDDVKKFVDLMAQLLSYVVKIADKVPTIAILGGLFGSSAFLGNSRRMGNLILFFEKLTDVTKVLKSGGGLKAWQTLMDEIIRIQSTGLAKGETTPIIKTVETLKSPATLASLAKTAGLIAAITVAYIGLAKAIDGAFESVEDIEKRMEDSSQKIQEYDSKLSELYARLDEISKMDMSSYSETQQQNLQDEAKYVKELANQYENLKTAYEEGYAKDREALWWGDQKKTPVLDSADKMLSGDFKGAWEADLASGAYRGDSKALQFLVNELLMTKLIGQFVPNNQDNKSEALDKSIEKYEELAEKIDKAREKRVEYLEKANEEENTEWDNEHDAFYSQQRADAYVEKADKQETKLIELNKERADIMSDILEKQSELMEMRSALENKPAELFTEEDALTINKIDAELEKIKGFLDENSTPTAIQNTTEALEDERKEAEKTYESIGALLSQDTLVDSDALDRRYDVLRKEYEKELELARNAGAEINRTVYGNIDLDDRGVLEWNEENLGKYKDAIESWGGAVEDYADSISTVDAMSEEFDGVEIAFTPMLQTPNGPEYLDSKTVHDYINALINQMPEGWTNEDLLKLDARGLEVDGKKIKGLIAEIGDEAIRVGETMHYLGEDGSLNLLRKKMDDVKSSATKWGDIRKDLVGLAQAGKLDETTLKEYKYFNEILKQLGIRADEAEDKLSGMVNEINKIALQNAVDDLANYRTEMNKLEDAYTKFKNGEFIDANTLSALQDAFGDLDSYQEFERAVMEGETELQEYFDAIATEYAKENAILAEVNDKNKEAIKQNLVLAGVTEESADASVEAALKKKKSVESEVRTSIEAWNTEVVLNQGRKDLAVSTENLDELTAEEIVLLMNEANAAGEAAREVALFTLKKELANGRDLRNPDDLDYLSELIIKCGVAAEEIDRLKRLGDRANTLEDAQAALDAFDARYKPSDIQNNANLQSERQKLVNRRDNASTAYDDYQAGAENLADRLEKEMEKVDYTVDIDFDYGGAIDSAEKAGEAAAENFKDTLDKILAMYDAELDAGVISFKDYVDKSRAIIEQYYNEGKIKASEYYDYLSSLYEKQVSEYDKVISAVQRKLQEETDELEKQKEAIEESYNLQIEEIQSKIDALQDENDEIERNIALQKAQYELARAKNQRTKLMYSESRGFYYEADLKGIQDAEENVRKAQLDKTVSELQKKITQLQTEMKRETDTIDEQIKKLQEYSEEWGKVSTQLQNSIEDQRAAEILGQNWEQEILDMRIDTLKNFTDEYIALQKAQKDAYLEARRAELDEVETSGGGGGKTKDTTTIKKKTTTDDNKKTKSGGEYSNPTADKAKVGKGYSYNGKTYSTLTEAQAAKQADVNGAYKTAYDKAYKSYPDGMPESAKQANADKAGKKAKEAANKKQIKALFQGSDSAKAGNTLVGELGSEIVLDKKTGTASIVEEPTIMKMKGGEKVFNADETEKILKSKYVPLKQFNPKKFAMLHAFASGTSSPMQSAIAAQAVGIANGLSKGLIPTTASGGQTINQTFNVSLPNITDASKAGDLFREFEQLQRKATQYFN